MSDLVTYIVSKESIIRATLQELPYAFLVTFKVEFFRWFRKRQRDAENSREYWYLRRKRDGIAGDWGGPSMLEWHSIKEVLYWFFFSSFLPALARCAPCRGGNCYWPDLHISPEWRQQAHPTRSIFSLLFLPDFAISVGRREPDVNPIRFSSRSVTEGHVFKPLRDQLFFFFLSHDIAKGSRVRLWLDGFESPYLFVRSHSLSCRKLFFRIIYNLLIRSVGPNINVVCRCLGNRIGE